MPWSTLGCIQPAWPTYAHCLGVGEVLLLILCRQAKPNGETLQQLPKSRFEESEFCPSSFSSLFLVHFSMVLRVCHATFLFPPSRCFPPNAHLVLACFSIAGFGQLPLQLYQPIRSPTSTCEASWDWALGRHGAPRARCANSVADQRENMTTRSTE